MVGALGDASADAEWINGQVWTVDGGALLRPWRKFGPVPLADNRSTYQDDGIAEVRSDMDIDGVVLLLAEFPASGQFGRVREAAAVCPAAAIEISE